ncbi:unnamed protein product [Pleuronectes platessa]|uniref:Uncharacterized protein n=1 Tax=Pleuronectes platessa TaxID=8262 RepID=A0A9N7TG18_PLEPL|nr:unnamed protein product [Pleuronectes platessa]
MNEDEEENGRQGVRALALSVSSWSPRYSWTMWATAEVYWQKKTTTKCREKSRQVSRAVVTQRSQRACQVKTADIIPQEAGKIYSKSTAGKHCDSSFRRVQVQPVLQVLIVDDL